MKLLQETVLSVFSIIMLIFAVVTSAILLNWLDFNFIGNFLTKTISNDGVKIAMLVVNAIIILLSLVCIFYNGGEKTTTNRTGILMENEKGNLLISRNALVKIINSVVTEFDSVKVDETNILLDKEGKVNIDIQISVAHDVIIKDLTNNIQVKVKDAIKKSSDLDVKTVNVGIQNVIDEPGKTAQA